MTTAAKMSSETAQASGESIVNSTSKSSSGTVAHTVSEDPTNLEPASEAIATTATKSSVVTTVESLPNELLANIFGYFDIAKPSESVLNEEPTFDVTNSIVTDLKAISCVSKRWRRATMPMLFRSARFIVAEPKTRRPLLDKIMAPFFDFVKANSLRPVITSFTLLVHDKKVGNTSQGDNRLNDFSNFWNSLFKIIDPVEFLLVAPAGALGALTACHIYLEDAWCFDCPCHYLKLQRAPTSDHESPKLKGVAPKEYPMTDQTHEIVEPVTENFSIHNIPGVLTHPPAEGAQATEESYRSFHRLDNVPSEGKKQASIPNEPSSSASASAPAAPSSQSRAPTRGDTSALFDVRPWTKLLLNEGSFIRAFATYEFWLRQPPSILPDLCGTDIPEHRPFISPTIREMSYIGIFPMQSHFAALVDHLPRLDRLYVQLVPRSNIMDDSSKMAQVEHTDLWMERNNCYAHFMRELFGSPPTGNYKHLQSFESGDAADKDAWLMAIEYVKRANNGWKILGDGVFARDPGDLVPENPEGGDEANSAFEGALIRWAWNGTTKLPVSAYPLYDRPLGVDFN